MNEDYQNNAPVTQLPPNSAQTQQSSGSRRQKLVLLLLLILALMVFFLLPRFVSEPWIAGDDAAGPVATPPAPSEVSPSTAAEKTRYRQDVQEILAEIILKRDQLLGQHVETWAGIEFRQALDNIQVGDGQYADGNYKASMSSYKQALKRLDSLSQLAGAKLDKALTDGVEAIESLDISAAGAASDLAHSIAPDDIKVKELAARSAILPEVAGLMQSADEALAARQLAAARSAYQAALELDPMHKRAAAALSAVKKDMLDSDFRKHMSAGYAALDRDEFDQARSSFLQAGRIYNDNESVAQALALVENQQNQAGIGRQIERAVELESREAWQQAVQTYEAILQQDPSLAEVKAKLIPAQVRSKLDMQLVGIIAEPLKLADNTAYREAQRVLNDARGISNPGERLRGQITAVEKLLHTAQSPVTVVFRSDNQTDVILYRVARLGQFEETTVELKPGRYIAAGTRRGFRDVRVEFTITGSPLDSPVVVRCEEPI